ncbi:hypothetical protein GGR51DRAFT_360374 [Nemania sp. FL0031]|nr:hypothetical protein GGR51DRAFT_360374 [Nemania sp. FL0031]
MCVKEIFSEMKPDGRMKTWSEAELCHNSRNGQFCDRTKELRRDLGYRRPEPKSPLYSHGQLPPTPPLSYHSDYNSDSERSSKRRSATYINDHKALDIGRRRSVKHERQASGERIVYVDSPHSPLSRSPLSRSPSHYRRSSVSSSPIRDAYSTLQPGSYRDGDDRSRERPTTIKVEIINERPKTHHRKESSSKTGSSRDSNEEDRRARRLSTDLYHGDQHRQRRRDTEIARKNEEIANRAPVPAPQPTPRYRRGSVSVISPQERVRLEEEKKQWQRELREEEIREAEKQRLKDRFNFKHYHYA